MDYRKLKELAEAGDPEYQLLLAMFVVVKSNWPLQIR
jgi:hypothetical protein